MSLEHLLGRPVPPPSATLLWTGAGASMDAPTRGPSGEQLLHDALDRLCLPGVREQVRSLFEDFGAGVPRLEAVLGVCLDDEAHGLSGLAVLGGLVDAPANRVHRFLAGHLQAGGLQVTANFDLCVEACVQDRALLDRILHLHGSLLDPVSVRAGASVVSLQTGFPRVLADRLLALLGGSDLVVVIGYSGSDAFDVDPLLARWGATGSGGQVMWVHHSAPSAEPRPVQLLRAGGVDVVEVTAPTVDVLDELAVAWGLPNVEPFDGAGGGPPRLLGPVGDIRARTAATTLLWHHLGASTRALEQLGAAGLSSDKHLEVEAEAFWGSGRYRAARRCWCRRFAGADPEMCRRRGERVGATLWAEGRFLAALAVLALTARRAKRAGLNTALVGETLQRVLDHMSRSPDTRVWVTASIRRWVAGMLPTPDAAVHGVELAARLRDVRGRRSAEELDVAVARALEDFVQFNSLHGWLNFTHGHLRRAALRGGLDPGAVREQHARARSLGRPESESLLVLTPGISRIFSAEERAAAADALDWTRYHRLRRRVAARRSPDPFRHEDELA